MTVYEKLIAQATGLADPDKISQVENYMRHIYFHSTLDWQTAAQLRKAARESAGDLELLGWNFI